ncbi:MAG: DUF3307 domain-containing protein [Bacilli bacterium]|nr:DUF3307 domain-containing protein [Bacilli bacterium]
MNLFLFLILGHIFGDFYLQTNEMASNKSKHFLRHIAIYTLIMVMIYLFLNGSDFVFIFGGVVFLSHLVIDGFNGYVIKNLHDRYNWIQIVVFLMDQMSHILVIVIFLNYFNRIYLDLNSANNYLLFITVVSYLIMPSSIVVSKVIAMVNVDESNNSFKLDEGTIIGILERLLIFAMGITGNLSGIGFLIAAKTMVRYGEFDDKNGKVSTFRAKYLIGTLTSVLLGVIFSLVFIGLKSN